MLHKRFRPEFCPEFSECDCEPKTPCDPCRTPSPKRCRPTSFDLNANTRINLDANPCFDPNGKPCGRATCIICKLVGPLGRSDMRPNAIACNNLASFTGHNICRPRICEMNPKYRFFILNLVSNLLNRARIQDLNLINPWGMLFIDSILWVADNGTGLITSYDQRGTKLSFSVNVTDIPTRTPSPTGLVENQTSSFIIPTTVSVTNPIPSFLLVATQNGSVSGFNPQFNPNNTVICINRANVGAVYTGITLANNNLYVCDFHNGRIDVFNGEFTLLTGFNFIDGDTVNPLPNGYAPFNIVLINGLLYVTYALLESPLNITNRPGQGNGYVSIFTFGGVFVRRYLSRGFLNSPWSIVPAPEAVGFPIGTLFVGNNGDGLINTYDTDGTFLGRLTDYNGFFIQLSGLWSLVSNNPRSIYFSSGPNSQTDGLVGLLTNQL